MYLLDLMSIVGNFFDIGAGVVDVDDFSASFAEEMVMHTLFEIISCFSGADGGCLDDAVVFEGFKGVVYGCF